MNDKVVVTIGRQFGSGGREIGQKLAEVLGIDYLDKELLASAARSSGLSQEVLEHADEKPVDPLSYAIHMPGSMYSGCCPVPMNVHNMLTDDKLFSVQAEAIRSEADKRSCVLVGRCSDYLIGDKPWCVNVFVHGSMDWRKERIAEGYHISEEEAGRQIARIDKRRASYYNFYTGHKWGAAVNYHLCIDVSHIGIDGAVELIRQYVAINLKNRAEEKKLESE